MRKILNALLVALILFVGNYFWPEAIVINSTKTLILAVVVYMVCDFIFAFAVCGISGLLAITMNAFLLFIWGISIFIIALAWVPLKLWILSTYVPGFSIVGTLTWVLLSIIILTFSIEKKDNQKKVTC